MRIAYAGSPDAAVAPLRALHDSPHQVALVVTQPDRARGRRGTPTPTPVGQAALELGLPLLRPESINAPEALAALEQAAVDALVVVAFGQILRDGVLSRWPCVNVHFSLLPAYRGAAPVERAIMDGRDETGVTIMMMDAGLDTGPTVATARTPIGPDDTGGALTARLSGIGAELLVGTLTGIASGDLVPTPQPEEGVTIAPKIGPGDRVIDRAAPAAAVARRIRALAPHIGATCVIDGEPFKVWGARESALMSTAPLSSAAGRLVLACADGAVEITELQPPGKGRMTASDFLRGWRGHLEWGAADV